tara:strand:- start:1843 stop:2757 length:915 start_codon:yes stop_codon:yes gene_type:complete
MINKYFHYKTADGFHSSSIPKVLKRVAPEKPVVPIVVDSPHSGTNYPADFDCLVPKIMLRRAEDSYVGELFSDAPRHGATFIEALYPRSYIDPNRSLDDLDPDLVEDDWPSPIIMGEKARLGHGLIWRLCPPEMPMYRHRLTEAKVRHRIEKYWRPYHQCLSNAIDKLHNQFGETWHINCHSMPSGSAPSVMTRCGRVPADFVLGDRDGTTCDIRLRKVLSKTLEEMGYAVALNDPYKGVELVRAHSDPGSARHSIQIEINRAIYMNERSLERLASFDTLKANINQLLNELARFSNQQISVAAE